jgi:hypothetical protein
MEFKYEVIAESRFRLSLWAIQQRFSGVAF